MLVLCVFGLILVLFGVTWVTMSGKIRSSTGMGVALALLVAIIVVAGIDIWNTNRDSEMRWSTAMLATGDASVRIEAIAARVKAGQKASQADIEALVRDQEAMQQARWTVKQAKVVEQFLSDYRVISLTQEKNLEVSKDLALKSLQMRGSGD